MPVHETCVGAGVLVVHKYRDSAYGLTLVWAFVAVYDKQQSGAVRITALVCVAVSFMMSFMTILRRRHVQQPNELTDMRQPLNRV